MQDQVFKLKAQAPTPNFPPYSQSVVNSAPAIYKPSNFKRLPGHPEHSGEQNKPRIMMMQSVLWSFTHGNLALFLKQLLFLIL